MTTTAPAWLVKAAGGSTTARYDRLVAARLASERTLGKGGFTLSSGAFEHGGQLDPCFTADEEDAVAPPLEWTAPPPGTQEVVLVVEDAHSAADTPFCHWLVWGMPGQKGQILEGETPQRVGKNSFGNSEWLLPDPPTGDAPHDFVFQLYALDLPLVLMPGASREELEKEMENHVLAAALLTGRYAREEGGDYDWNEQDETE